LLNAGHLSSIVGGGPSMSHVLQQPVVLGTSQLAAATALRKHDSSGGGLTPSLSNYVNNGLVDHVASWPTEAVERRVSN